MAVYRHVSGAVRHRSYDDAPLRAALQQTRLHASYKVLMLVLTSRLSFAALTLSLLWATHRFVATMSECYDSTSTMAAPHAPILRAPTLRPDNFSDGAPLRAAL